jgi:RNA polymerase sigma factor (sigma-70 family)
MALATDNINLLFAAVNKAVHDRTKRDECVQDAWFYFYRAAQLFDPDRDAEFSTYAYSYLRGSILTSLRRSSAVSPTPLP